MKKNLVSVIMNCYNGERHLKEALNSLVKQSFKNWELIFYDNCSTDSSSKILKSYKDKRIKYFKNKKNIRLGLARKLAYKKCSGNFIAFLDCDDIWLENKLTEQLKFFKNSKVGIVISNSLIFNNKRSIKLYPKNNVPTGMIFYHLLENYFISLETVIIKKIYANKLKEDFKECYNIIHDLDLLTRLSKICLVKYCPKILSKWRVQNNSQSFNKDNIVNYEKRLFINDISKTYIDDINFQKARNTYLKNINLNEALNLLINNKKTLFLKKVFQIKINFKLCILCLFCIFPFGSNIFKRIYYYKKLYN
jgi:glycosyltransferase involved in cell wall biosynthesis